MKTKTYLCLTIPVIVGGAIIWAKYLGHVAPIVPQTILILSSILFVYGLAECDK